MWLCIGIIFSMNLVVEKNKNSRWKQRLMMKGAILPKYPSRARHMTWVYIVILFRDHKHAIFFLTYTEDYVIQLFFKIFMEDYVIKISWKFIIYKRDENRNLLFLIRRWRRWTWPKTANRLWFFCIYLFLSNGCKWKKRWKI